MSIGEILVGESEKMIKFREHRELLVDSMKTIVNVTDRAALISLLRPQLLLGGLVFNDEDLEIKPYGWDGRINWNTHIVTIKNIGVIGFTDGLD